MKKIMILLAACLFAGGGLILSCQVLRAQEAKIGTEVSSAVVPPADVPVAGDDSRKKPADAAHLLDQCVRKLEATGKSLERMQSRLADWKRNSCISRAAAQKGAQEAAVWRGRIEKLLAGKIRRALKRCHMQIGERGCQKLQYELEEDGLKVSGKVLDRNCIVRAFQEASAGIDGLALDIEDLHKISVCSLCEDDAVPYCVMGNTRSNQPSCVNREEADKVYKKLPPEGECSKLGEAVAGWQSFSDIKRFWVLGEDENVYLCFYSYKRWRLRRSNLIGNCGRLLLSQDND